MARLLLYLFDLIFVTIMGWILARIAQRLFGNPPAGPRAPRASAPRGSSPPAIAGETARDPVCGMFVSTELSHQLRRGGETLHFCSRECLERFQANAPKS
ncbi:MAG: YHS domain-containing protein [Acidobacteriia bacterium]|nr:YHS domain-containing protein [Terriglobia bacterium]